MARRTLKSLPGGTRLARLGEAAVSVPMVLRSGIFDREWYEIQARQTFSSGSAAARHYVVTGRRAGLSPHPLFEPEFWDSNRWKKVIIDPLVRYTRKAGSPPHPLFDVHRYLQENPEAGKHRFGPLGHFVEHATAATTLPTPPLAGVRPVVSWGEAREVMLAQARVWAGQEALRVGRRVTDSYDKDAERRFLRRVAGLPLPETAAELPLVSIITPVMNRPEQIVEAIRSVQAQTMTNWELIVVDDGSTDNTADVVDALAGDDARITLIRRENAGVCRARNTGAEVARGKYIAWLDSDNTWLPHFLGTTVTAMAADGLRAAYSGMAMQMSDKLRYRTFDGGREHLLLGNHIDLNVLLVTAELLEEVGGFDETLKRTVDYDLVLRFTEHTPITFLPFIGAEYHHDSNDATRITTMQPPTWREVVMNKHLIDWPALDEGLAQRVPGRVSLLVPTYEDWRMTRAALRAVLADAGAPGAPGHDVEIVITDNGSRRAVSALLAGYAAMDPRVRIVRVAINLNFGLGSNLALAASTGETVVFLNNDTEVREGWLDPIRAALGNDDVLGAQPLLIYPDGTVQCAGLVFPERGVLPSHFLVDHPADDAYRMGEFAVTAVTGAALALRARDAVELRGFDPIFANGLEDVDLCLRLRQRRPGAFRVLTDSVVVHHESKSLGRKSKLGSNRLLFTDRWHADRPPSDEHLWRQAGFEVAHYALETTSSQPVPLQIAKPIVIRPRRDADAAVSGTTPGMPSLRWAIKTGAPATAEARAWGDVHFAHALGASLERLGQNYVVDPRTSHVRASSYLDDVVVSLRGLTKVEPQPGRINIMWIISHPEAVTAKELAGFDAVFAASLSWAAEASERFGVDVAPLLQATDPERFHPDAAYADSGAPILFVGNSRRVYRPVVKAPVEAGLDVHVYGSLWEDYISASHIKGRYFPNEQLAAAYRGAGVVLNDHWSDMRRDGFVSNRLFDAVAAGARVVSDDVAGAQELFGASVRTYSTPEELVALLRAPVTETFPDDETIRAQAQRVRTEHSFDARAGQLLETAARLWKS